jgi:hypothetical protein
MNFRLNGPNHGPYRTGNDESLDITEADRSVTTPFFPTNTSAKSSKIKNECSGKNWNEGGKCRDGNSTGNHYPSVPVKAEGFHASLMPCTGQTMGHFSLIAGHKDAKIHQSRLTNHWLMSELTRFACFPKQNTERMLRLYPRESSIQQYS